MKLLECLENEAFNELINFSFEEVKTLFNWYAYYVPTSKAEPFVSEASAVKIKYEEDIETLTTIFPCTSEHMERRKKFLITRHITTA